MTMIACLGPDIPMELLTGTGRYAGPLGWNIDRDFPLASQWLESKFPRWAFSVVEDWAAGALDHLDTVVFSRGDDSAQRLYYYICELRSRGLLAGPEPVIFDVARIARASSEARCVESVRKLALRLKVDNAALEAAIAGVQPVSKGQGGHACSAEPRRRMIACTALSRQLDGRRRARRWPRPGWAMNNQQKRELAILPLR
jgi:hypothetical protein